jgi:hypothetical protein
MGCIAEYTGFPGEVPERIGGILMAALTINDIPQTSQDTLEIACKALEWDEKPVTAETVEQYLKSEACYQRPYVVHALIAVFVAHWNSPVDAEVAS